MSQFDRFRTEQILTERQFLNERNCFHHNAMPENLACYRLSLVILFIRQIKIFGWLFVLFTSFACILKNRLCLFLKHPFQMKLKQNNTFFSGIINLLFDGLTYNTRGHFAHCSHFSPSCGARKNTTQLAKSPRVLYVKPSNKMYIRDLFVALIKIKMLQYSFHC